VTRSADQRPAFVVLGLLLSPLTLRFLLVLEENLGFRSQDLRGVVADAFAAALAFAVLVLVGCVSRLLASLLVLPWTLLHYANYEVVRALDANATLADVRFLGDATFAAGSATAISRPFLLAGLVLLSWALCWLGLKRPSLRHSLASGVLAGLLLAILGLWPWSAEVSAWRQTDLIHQDLTRLVSTLSNTPSSAIDDPATSLIDLAPDLAGDLEGEPRFPLPGKGRNVLLVVLESVSGAYVGRLIEEHWNPDDGRMPVLDSVARGNLAYATFINHQRRTNRGLYALLCGDMPNLADGLPKMSSYVIDGTRRCLPEILRDQGYATTYLQAAPLVFMLKDQFMPSIGFQAVHGDEWFTSAYARSAWGVDDRAFFEQSIRMIEYLQNGDRPWFLTLLTVGTHHPYVIPDEFKPEIRSDFIRSTVYLDRSLEGFIRDLEALGVLEDTLVLFTSDESNGRRFGDNRIARSLSQNWGVLVAVTPESIQNVVTEPFAQIDLPLSILDYLDFGEEGGHLLGRSVFRSYREPRSLFFGNANTRMVGALDIEGRLVMCLGDFARCHIHRPRQGRLFGEHHERLADEAAEFEWLRDFAQRSVGRRPDSRRHTTIDLQSQRFETVDSPTARLLHGGQFLDLDHGEWINVEIDVAVQSAQRQADSRAGVILAIRLGAVRKTELYYEQFVLRPGDRLRLAYTYAPRGAVREVQSQLLAHSPGGESFDLKFNRSRIIWIREGEPPSAGVEVYRKTIDSG
jgi:hypothetical protein